MRSGASTIACFALLVFLTTGGVDAQSVSSRHGLGPYMGFGSDPDQFLVGGQGVFGLNGSPVHLSPSLDFGFGDDINTITMNFDVTYDFVPSNARVAFYLGAGPTLAFYSSDRFDSDSEAGMSLVTGVKLPNRRGDSFNLGLRAGFGDIPDIKFTAAYLFRMK